MEQNNPPLDDSSLNVFSLPPYTNSQPDQQVSNRDKAGATLLFSGFFLGLVGITLTVIGWIKRENNETFGWVQMMGPMLLTVGVTFVLISVCRYKMHACKSSRRGHDATIDPEQLSAGQSFVFTGMNQPITFHGATVVQYIPPPYTTHDVTARSPNALPPFSGDSSDGISPPIFPPHYYSIYPLENPAFVEDEEDSQSPDHQRSPVSRQQQEHFPSVQRQSGEPPLYDDLFPDLKVDVQS